MVESQCILLFPKKKKNNSSRLVASVTKPQAKKEKVEHKAFGLDSRQASGMNGWLAESKNFSVATWWQKRSVRSGSSRLGKIGRAELEGKGIDRGQLQHHTASDVATNQPTGGETCEAKPVQSVGI